MRGIFMSRDFRRARGGWLIIVFGWCLAGGFSIAAVAQQPAPPPPVAAVKPTTLELHGITRVDNYYWLRERESPEVIDYLTRENDYTSAVLAPADSLRAELFVELKGREKQADWTVPYPEGSWWYYSHTEEDQQYPIHCRRVKRDDVPAIGTGVPVADIVARDSAEQVLVDVNELAQGHEFCSVSSVEVTSDGKLMAMAVDLVGRRIYTIRFRNLETGQYLSDEILNVTSNLVWAEDNQTLFYVRQDPETLRSFQVYRHRLGTDSATDQLVFQEDDEEFNVGVGKTRSHKFIAIVSQQTLSTETWFIDAAAPDQEPVVFLPRRENHEYSVDHLGDRFYVVTNDEAENFRLAVTDAPGTPIEQWTTIIPHRADVLLEDVVLLDDWLVAVEKHEAATRLRVLDLAGQENHTITFDETAYWAIPAPIQATDTPWLRLMYMSLSTPPTYYDYNLATHERVLVKREEILGGFDATNYISTRLWATARDGARVPVSVVHRRDTPLDGTAPLLVYGYGSYGFSMDPFFSADVISLLDRGWVYAIAHVRGGQEMGRAWYENGRMQNKINTFTDFIDVTEFLVREKYGDPHRVYANGGSAGGLLMGAVVNMRPDLYHGVVAEVPFVDVVTTMLDDTIPLTTSEYDEWGNPHEKPAFDYMLSYSPYDNVVAQDYPNILVTTGLHDSQVQYWEPAKWVAKLRAMKTDNNLLLLKTNMDAGHGGASGRFDRYEETALQYAFLIHLAQSTIKR